MQLHENTLLDRDLSVKAQFPLHQVTDTDTKFEVATSNGYGGDAFTMHYLIIDLDIEVKVTQNVAQYALLHVT